MSFDETKIFYNDLQKIVTNGFKMWYNRNT